MPPERPDGDLRVGDAERDELAAALGRHYVAGRLEADELSRRLDVVYAARWRSEAAAAAADLPAATPPDAPRRRWRGRRHGEGSTPAATWVPTTERFLDPTTGRTMRVWLDRADHHRRHYVAERSG